MSRTAALPGWVALVALGLTACLAVDAADSGSHRRATAERPDNASTVLPSGKGLATDAAAAAPRAARPAASFRWPKGVIEAPEPAPVAPLSLTASDGTGLALVALAANAVLEPPLAFTELHLTFDNPRDEVIEGRFRVALPSGAALSRFAMEIGGRWQEAEVVERQRARRAYEDFLHRRQDPALLEQEAGNEFSARVFPIPARGRKEVVIAYAHALARADEPYILRLLGLPEVGRLDVRVLLGERPAADIPASNLGGEVRDRRVVELHRRAWTPDADLVLGQDRVGPRAGLRHGNLAVVRVAAPVEAEPREIGGLFVLFDSSASRALGYAAQVERLGELTAGLAAGAGGDTPLGVVAFDQEVVPIFEGAAGDFGAAEVRRLAGRRRLGASDLGRALGWLAERLATSGRRYPRVLLVTDGVATAGDTDPGALKAAVAALGAHGVERLDALAVGGLRDEAVLAELVTGNLAEDGQRLDGALPLVEIARRLTLACRSGIAVEVEGAAWVWPDRLDGVQPGDEVLLYADLPAAQKLAVALDGRPVGLAGEVATAERPLLERAWAQARIDRLLHLRATAPAGDADLRRALVREAAELSVAHRVLSPFTALLVLETEADYARYGLDRRALADILTVGPAGLDVLARSRHAPPRQDAWAVAGRTRRDASGEDPAALEALGYLGRGEDAEAPAEPLDATVSGGADDGLEAGVAGEVAGGVAGGVPGGTPGGIPGGVAGGEPPSEIPEPVQVGDEATSESEADASALRVAPPAGARADQVEEVVAGGSTGRLFRGGAPRYEAESEQDRGGKATGVAPYTGRYAEVMAALGSGALAEARRLAEAWSAEAPGDVLALLALGEAWEAAGESTAAARAYGSLIDLFPSRADLRRLAGERLERLGSAGLELAIDTYAKAVLDRPDHPSGHRLLAWALVAAGRFEEAFAALEKGLEQPYPDGRFAGVDRILREDFGLLAAAWVAAEPERREEVLARLAAHGARLEGEPSLRFVLTWETDANDVDLHVYDRRGGHAYYGARTLPSGGELFADVTTGYGPECFAVEGPAGKAARPYRLEAHYYSRGPMGYGMGLLQVVAHDGRGRLAVEPRPFVVMADHATVELGKVEEPGPRRAAAR